MSSRSDEFQKARSEPDALAKLLEEALERGDEKRALPWAEHLHKIDPDPQRRYALPARIFSRNGQVSKAEKLLERYEKLYGEDVTLLLTRASIADERKLPAKGEELLLRALQKDPNRSDVMERYLGHVGSARVAALEKVATFSGSWLANIYLAEALIAELRYEEAVVIVNKVMETSDDDLPRAAALAQLIDAGLHDHAIHIAKKGADSLGEKTKSNVLHALIRTGRLDDARALLATMKASDPNVAIFAQCLEARGAKKNDNSALMEALANVSRFDSAKSRQRFYRKLLNARLRLPIRLPLVRSRPDAISSKLPLLHDVEPVTRMASHLAEVLICFSDLEAMRLWSPDAFSIELNAREIFDYAINESELEVVINPAGPSSAVLWRKELSALAGGEVPTLEESDLLTNRSYFLIEPLAKMPSDEVAEELRRDLAEYPEITEAYYFELVHERHGRAAAVALAFSPGYDHEEKRDALFDLVDPSVHRQRKQRLQFLELNPALAPEIRRRGYWLIEPE